MTHNEIKQGEQTVACKFGSSEEIVGGIGFGQLAKSVMEGEFEDRVGAEAVRFSHSDFRLVVQALDDASGK